MVDNIETGMTDEELIGYMRLHSETERGLCSKNQVGRLLQLAGKPNQAERVLNNLQEWYGLTSTTTNPLCDLALENLKNVKPDDPKEEQNIS